jgi:hypothetical protein
MKTKKIIFLTLSLLLPVAIFIFLKLFGRNQFDVPVMYQEGSIHAPARCKYTYNTPYHIPDSVMMLFARNKADSLYVLYFRPGLNVPLNRIALEFDGDPVAVIAPSGFPEETDLTLLQHCVLLMQPPSSVVLVDQRNRIRGYYNGSDRDEIDRLIVEMKIILKQY